MTNEKISLKAMKKSNKSRIVIGDYQKDLCVKFGGWKIDSSLKGCEQSVKWT